MITHLKKAIGLTVAALCICLCLSGTLSAQTITGNIGGLVTDATGAAVPGAKVTATNVDTGVSVSTTTNAGGSYSIRFLQIGNYKITIDGKGFSKSVYGPYTLEIDQIAKVDAQLKIGAATDTVEVSGALAPILNTDNSQIDTTFDANTLENTPLSGQNFSAIMQYMPGAVSTQPSGFQGVQSVERNTGSSGQVSVNGNRLQQNNYLWDGVEINETINNLIGYNPNPDAIQEMKVVSANPNAEYGNVTGGDVLMVMKSGTNQFHGSAFYYLQNENLNANTWGNKHVTAGTAISPRPVFTSGTFGGGVGGPIIKDKLFFYADFMAGRLHQSATQPLYLATALMRQGNFSELLNPSIMCNPGDSATLCNGELIQLYDPTNNFAPYAGNLNVPIVNPVAKYLYAHPEVYPEPNHAPLAGGPTIQNFLGISRSYNKYDQGDVKIDYTPTSKDRFFFHYTQADGTDGNNFYPVPVFFQNGSEYPDKIFVANWVRTLTPSLVNELRAGFSRIRWEQGDPIDTTGEFGLHGDSTVGICNGCSQPFEGFAGQNVSALNTPGNPAGGTNFIDNTFDYAETLTWSHGNHNSKAGVEFIRYQQNNFYPGNDGALGNFTYNGVFTSNPNVGAPGYGVADFVLDRVEAEGIGGVAGRTGQRQYRDAYFAQDDWRASPKLTLNLGVRYEYDQPIYEVNNKTANVNLATGSVEYAGSIPSTNTVPGATVCPNRACYNPTHTDFMPRLGFAYSATPRLVLRGGYGITTYLEGTGANLRLTYNPPFQPSFEATGTGPSAPNNPGTFFQVENGFSSATNANYSGTTYRAWAPNLKPMFVQTYSLSTQYEVNSKSSITLAYVGENGQHLIQAVAANQLFAPCVLNGVFQSNPNSAACAAADPAPFQALVGQSGSVVETASEGEYNANEFQATYRQRTTQGLEFTVNYAWAKALTNTDGFFGVPNISGPSPYAENAYNNHEEYGPVGQDIRNNLNGTVVYKLPYGRGQRFGSGINPLLNEALGGWQVGFAGVMYSGFPVTPYVNENYAGTNNRAIRPNQYFKIPVKNRSIDEWFGNDPSILGCTSAGGLVNSAGVGCAYGAPGNGQYGDAAPNSLRGPGYQDLDMTASKDFHLFREHNIGFKADAFNVLNHASYSNPNSTVDPGSAFGQITSVRSTERRLQLNLHYMF